LIGAGDVENRPAAPIFLRTAADQRPDKEHPMPTVTSRDGTSIFYDRLGDGPPVILVTGGSVDRSSNAGLAAELAGGGFTAYNYDRRGRGPSGDTPPYAIEREIEDIAAVIEVAGGRAHLYGSSSGAVLAMRAAAAGLPVAKLAMWEPPYSVHGRPDLPDDTASVYRELVEAGRRGDAAEYFMAKVVGMPPEFVAGARQQPWWPQQEALAHTLAYDAEIMGDYTIPTELARSAPVPTLVVIGAASFGFFDETADALVELIPDARRSTLEGQEHNVDPAALAPALAEFFKA
jgi:alpha-beta hydrolase superfamily lysophospholipase